MATSGFDSFMPLKTVRLVHGDGRTSTTSVALYKTGYLRFVVMKILFKLHSLSEYTLQKRESLVNPLFSRTGRVFRSVCQNIFLRKLYRYGLRESSLGQVQLSLMRS